MKLPLILAFPRSRDWSDLLHPMVVKEARQSVRSWQYALVFGLLQIAMLFYVLSLLDGSSSGDMDNTSGVFWSLVGIYLLGILPLSALGTLAKEKAEGRLDLLQLTQLEARGIVVGKWISLNLQGGLVVVSLLPYLALRYFIGSINLVAEFWMLCAMLGGALALTAAGVWLSVFKSQLIRVFIGGGVGIVIVNGVAALVRSSIGAGVPFFALNVWAGVLLLALGFVVIALFLEFAASGISHRANNHETSQRLLVIVAMGITGILCWVEPSAAIMGMAVLAVMICAVSIAGLMRAPSLLPGVYVPLLRWGLVGRWLFYPGWPSALRFLLLVVGSILALVYGQFSNITPGISLALLCLGLLGSLLLPRALVEAFGLQRRATLGFFWLVQALGVLLYILVSLIESTQNISLMGWLCFLPQAGVFIGVEEKDLANLAAPVLVGNGAVTAGCLLICFWRCRRWRATERELLAEAREMRLRRQQGQPSTTSPPTAPSASPELT